MSKGDSTVLSSLLTETVTLLCRNSVQFSADLKIQGLLVVTADSNQVFVVEISNTSFAQCPDTSAGLEDTDISGVRPGQSLLRLKSAHSSPYVRSLKRKCLTPAFRHVRRVRASSEQLVGSRAGKGTGQIGSRCNISDGIAPFPKVEPLDQVVVLDSADDSASELSQQKTEKTDDYTSIPASGDSHHVADVRPRSARRHAVKSSQCETAYFNNSFGNDHFDKSNHSVGCSEQTFEGDSYPPASDIADSVLQWSGNVNEGMTIKQDMDEDFNAFVEGLQSPDAYDGQVSGDVSQFGEAKHHCEFPGCGMSYMHRSHLYRHQRRVHGTRFGSIGQLTYVCSVNNCRRTFLALRSYAKHQRDVHGILAQH